MSSRLQISEVAAGYLERWLDQTMRGELALHRLPAPVAAWWFAGYAEGIAHARRQAAEYEHQLDQLYLAAFSPKDRAAEYQRRLDEHFRLEDAAFFAAAEESDHDTDRSNGTQQLEHRRAA